MSQLRRQSRRLTSSTRQRRFRRLMIEACEVRALLSFDGWPQLGPEPQLELHLPAAAPSNVEGNLADLYAIAMASPERTIVAADGAALEPRADVLQLDAAGRPLVDVWTRASPAAVAARLRSLEAEILATDEAHRLVEAWLDWEDVPAVAELDGVLSLTPVFRPLCRTGSVTSQGDAILHADDVRNPVWFPPGGYDGAGVKVGVLSDSVSRVGQGLGASVASGDLPAGVEVLRDYLYSGGTDEGRAMLEIVHDLAPGAALAFRTAFYSEFDFAQGIRELAQAGAQVIVDDVAYFVEPVYQDGIIAQAIDEVVHDYGVTYVTAAGNENGDMHSASFRAAADVQPGVWHDFDATEGVDTRLRITVSAGSMGMLVLQWSDPWYTQDGVTNDFDLYALDTTSGAVVDSVATNNVTTQQPMETFLWGGHPYETRTYDVGIKRVAGDGDVELKLWTISGTMTEYQDGASLVGHAMAAGAISVGAVPFYDPDTIESYSSRGAVTVYFDPQGNRLATPEVRQKPDLVATDEVSTSFFGEDIAEDADTFPNFAGTSAAAPHVAAIAAQLRSAQPSLSPSQVLAVLRSEADDLGTTGWDDIYGAGRVNALTATGEALTNPAYDDTTGPTVTLLSPGPSAARPIGFALLQFNEALDGTTAAEAGNYEVRSSGDDGLFDNADDVVYTVAAAYDGTARRTRLTWTEPGAALPISRYRLTVGSGVHDLAGNPLGAGTAQEFVFERTVWGVPIDVLPPGMSGADVPVVAVDGTGRSAAVWLEPAIGPNGTFRDIALSLYDANGAKVAGPVSVAAPYQMEPFGEAVPDVALGADGSVVVVYNDRWDYYTDSVYAVRFAQDGTVLGQSTVALWGFHNREKVAVAPNGDFLVVWVADSRSGTGDVTARFYHSDATPKGDAFPVDPGYSGSSPNVAVDDDGDFVVAWSRRLEAVIPNAPRDICARRFDHAGNPRGEIFRVNTTTETSEAPTIDVAVAPSGMAVIAWHWGSVYSPSGTVLARTFASDGTALRDPWLISSTGKHPGLAMNSAGDFVVAWSSGGKGYAWRHAADGTPAGDPYQAGVSASLGMDDQGAILHSWAEGQILWYVPPLPAQPDLRVTALSFLPIATIGERIELTSTVFNFGVATAAAAQLQYYLSPDAEITGTGNDRPLLTTPAGMAAMWGGTSATDFSRTSLPADVTPGTWWLGALADVGQTVAETDETNNALALPIVLAEPPPRLGREFRVNTTTAGAQTTPAIAARPDGSFVVIWSGKGPGDDQGVFLQRYSATLVPDAAEQRVNQTTTGVQSAPAVAAAADGSFVVTWESPDASGKGVYARRYDPNAAPLGDEFRVNTTTAGDQSSPDVSVATDGTFTVAWTTLQTGDWSPTGIRSQRYDGNGALVGAEVTVSTNVNGYASHPVVASLPDGRSLVAWEYGNYGNAGFDLHYRLLGADGQPAGSDQLVVSGGCWLYSSLAVASDASGRSLLVWQTWDQVYFDVYGQWISPSGERVGSAFVVNSNKTGCSNVDVAVLADGNFIVEWSTGDASSAGVYAQRFTPDGSWVGGEWRVNEYVTNAQVLPKATGLRDDLFAVVWASMNQDGDANGIFAQVFGTAPTDSAELQAVSVAGPVVTYLGGPLPATAAIRNAGGVDAVPFLVQYFLFADPWGPPLLALGEPLAVDGLAAGAAWEDTRSMTVPSSGLAAGTYYVGLVADTAGTVAEHVELDNTLVSLVPVIVSATAPPDLQVSSVSVAETSVVRGRELTVTWTVANLGIGATPSTTWYDQVILSADPVFGNADDLAADGAMFAHAGGLAKDATYTQTQTVSIPFALAGSVYVFVKADATNVISEPAYESNNSAGNPSPRPVTEVVAALPVAEGFEGGSLAGLPNWWALDYGVPGRARIAGTNGPHSGAYQLLMDSAYYAGTDTQRAYLTLDVGQTSGVILRYWQKDFTYENENPLPDTFIGRVDGDGLAMSADGNQWYRLESLVNSDSTTSYQQHLIDLDAERLRRSLTGSNKLYLVFQHYGFQSITNNGFAFDDIGVAVESGDFWGARVVSCTPSGAVSGPISSVQVTFSEPVAAAGFMHDDVRLVDPAGRPVTIDDAGITTTDNVNFTIAFPSQRIAGAYQLTVGPQIPDLAGNAMNQDQDWVNGAADDVFTSSFQLPATTAALPVLESFEVGDLGELASSWSFQATSGALGVSHDAPHTGQSALRMSDTASGSSAAYYQKAILHVDLLDGTTPATGVTLDFWVKETSGGGTAYDASVSIKASGTTWTTLQNIAGSSTYQHYAFNLDALGLTYSDDVEIAFQHSNYYVGGFAWDDIRVRANSLPLNHAPTLTTISTLAEGVHHQPFPVSYEALAAAANEADADGDALSFRIMSVTSGTLTKDGVAVDPGNTLLASGEAVVWVPAGGGSAVNAFTVRAWDGDLDSGTSVPVTVAVTAADGALQFDAADDRVTVPYASSLDFAQGSSLTLEAWVYPSVLNGFNTIVAKNRTAGVENGNYILKAGGGSTKARRLSFYYRDASSWQVYETSSDVLQTGIWQHVAVTYTFGSGSSARIYVDGVLKAGGWIAGSGNTAPTVAADPLWIGAVTNSGSSTAKELWNGRIDDVRIWNYARTEEQIRATMEPHLAGNEPGLVGYWEFNETVSSQAALDKTANVHHGVLGSTTGVEANDPARVEHPHPVADLVDVTPDPRTTPVGLITVDFSEPVTGVDMADFRLTRDGSAVDISGLTVTPVTTAQYTLDLTTVTAVPGSYVLTLVAGGSGIRGIVSNQSAFCDDASETWRVDTLQVTGLMPTASGFVATFNGPLDATVLNLYDGAGGALGAADVVVLNGSGQNIAGSLIVAADLRAITWVATGDVLPAGTYTVTLTSGATALHHVAGHALDGDADGISGGDFATTFTVVSPPSGTVVVSTPDFARGAAQPVNIPNTAAGLPIRLDNAAGVTSLAVDLVYDEALLEITAATLGAGLPGDWSVVNPPDTSTPGVAKISVSGTTPLTGTNVAVLRLTAAVPDDASYGAVQSIRLENVLLNSGTIAAVGDVAVHKAVYLGDADGSGIHSSADAFLTVQAALGLASGFAAHAWTDPRIVGDADGSGVLSAADAFLIVQEGLGLDEPFVPDNPHIGVTPVGGGVDPQFQIGMPEPAAVGGSVTVPVKLAIEPAATNVGGADFELFFDPSQLTIQVPDGVSAGADTAGWAVSAILVAPGHLRVGMINSRGQPLAPGLRQIARLQFHVAASLRDAVPLAERAAYGEAIPVSERPGYVLLDIEAVDPHASGYLWTASDGGLRIAPAVSLPRIWQQAANLADGAPEDFSTAYGDVGRWELEDVLSDFAAAVARLWHR